MSAPLLIDLDDENLGYGNQTVLQGVRLRIQAGEKVALIGESGAGKSTLLKRLYRLHAANTALCSQELGLVPELSVYHNIYMGQLNRQGFLHNLANLIRPRRGDRAAVEEIARQLGLTGQLDTSVDQLSGGQMQRTALGRALHRRCPVFMGDEPVSSVDEYQADRLLELINHRHETVVVALHDQQLALSHYERIIGLKEGRICLDAPTRALTTADLAAVYRA